MQKQMQMQSTFYLVGQALYIFVEWCFILQLV